MHRASCTTACSSACCCWIPPPDPTLRIASYCEYGRISTLSTATLREMGYSRAVALDQGMQLWRERGYPEE